MGSYDLAAEFDSDDGAISVSPYWVVASWPFARHVTFDRNKIAKPPKPPNISTSSDISDAAMVKGDRPVLMHGDCTGLQITGSKSNHTMTMNATFLNSGVNYLAEVFPGDWVAAWIVYSVDKFHDLIRRIKKGEPCNAFDDGLKFVGKVQSMRKNLSVTETGAKRSVYSLQAIAFSEFANMLFYDTRLQMNMPFFADIVGKLDIAINELMSFDRNKGVDTNKFIPLALDLILGRGAPRSFASPSGRVQIAYGAIAPPTGEDEPSAACIVPAQVARILGQEVPGTRVGLFSYADILNVVVGIQRYEEGGHDWRVFIPSGADGPGNRKVFADLNPDLQLIGTFQPVPMPFINKPIWALLNQFLNPVVNEMFTSLRVNGEGRVVPTLTVRQIPFTSDAFAQHKIKRRTQLTVGSPMTVEYPVVTTRFLELPRWRAPARLLRTLDIGRSDQARFNFIHVYGEPVLSQPITDLASQIVRNPPLSDEQDIRRTGIRPFMTTVNCSPTDAAGDGARVWMQLAADFHMGQQYMFNGTVGLIGISAPICPGDNFELDGVVYHIENVSHNCSISDNGRKQFVTYLALSHGVRSDTDVRGIDVAAMGLDDGGRETIESLEDLRMYPGMDRNDNTAFDPGHTSEIEGEDY